MDYSFHLHIEQFAAVWLIWDKEEISASHKTWCSPIWDVYEDLLILGKKMILKNMFYNARVLKSVLGDFFKKKKKKTCFFQINPCLANLGQGRNFCISQNLMQSYLGCIWGFVNTWQKKWFEKTCFTIHMYWRVF